MSASVAANRRRVSRRPLAVAALVLVPLAVVGLLAGALSAVGSEDGRIPAAIVNQDEMVQQTGADGSTTPIVAGRLLVTALTGGDAGDGAAATAFDWTITGEDEAREALADGSVYAVITIPEDFSKSVVSLGGDNPVQANLSLVTDDAHGYVTGPLADALGDGLAAIFGTELSKQYIAGLVGGTGSIGGQLTQAADGARQLQSGGQALASGLTEAATQSGTAASGAAQAVSGLETYTDGVASLSAGLGQASSQSAGLQQLPAGVSQYTGAVGTVSQSLKDAVAAYNAGLLPAEQLAAAVGQAAGGLDTLNAQAAPGLQQGAQGAAALQSGVAQSASGAQQLAANGPALVSGFDQIATGIGQLSTGIGQSATGASQLADGAGTLADGLQGGADQVPGYSEDEVDQIASVAADPVSLTTARENEVSSIPQIVSTLLVPAGLWIGALAVFLVLGAPTRRTLVTAASTGRIAFRTIGRAAALGAVQAVLLVVLLHTALGVAWGAIGATLPFALLVAVAFAAIHAMLTTVFGRGGLVVSLVVLALQLISTGGLYPIELISEPFRALSPLLPLTGAVDGMQAIITGSGPAGVVSGVVSLLLWALISAIVTLIALARRRSARALGLVAAPA
ncbi:YhgE/Pip domain-containing protein [Herbiconiux sp. L3-i23]|uniref:YhgE/Pip domain-containing protein n=1 Tax=Herbiconiux sp. L3-i23 TaxID=2905871 RepID=UPI002056898D|nr:YhgE/Pip family protein [Herbiconiux sp. L3-i23]BDI21741.1 hypothetical protein L3i23_05170 [Herbiconiux sp. L3-i23]